MSASPSRGFADLLRSYRREAGLTQETLAERARISVRAVSDLERGLYRAPHADTVRLLANALSLSEVDRATLEAAVLRRRGPRAAPHGAMEAPGMTARRTAGAPTWPA